MLQDLETIILKGFISLKLSLNKMNWSVHVHITKNWVRTWTFGFRVQCWFYFISILSSLHPKLLYWGLRNSLIKTSQQTLSVTPLWLQLPPTGISRKNSCWGKETGRKHTITRVSHITYLIEETVEIHMYTFTSQRIKENVFTMTVSKPQDITNHWHNCGGTTVCWSATVPKEDTMPIKYPNATWGNINLKYF